jgi:hypothetical protein
MHELVNIELVLWDLSKFVPVLFLTEHHTMKAYCGSGFIAPRILDLGTRLKWVISFTPCRFNPQGKSLWYPPDRRLRGPKIGSERCGEEKNYQPCPGLEPPIIQPSTRNIWNTYAVIILYRRYIHGSPVCLVVTLSSIYIYPQCKLSGFSSWH